MTHHRVNMQRVTKKLRRMTAPASIQKNGFGMSNCGREEDFIHINEIDDGDASFQLYVPYRKRSSQSIFESDEEGEDTRPYSHADRHSFHDPNIIRRSKLKVAESPTEKHGKDGKNPFSFKTFIKKEKRKAVYYSSREQLDSSGMEEEDWTEDMGNQNGTAPSGGAAPEVSNANSGTTSNTTSSSSGSSSSNNGRTNQRRATSPGMPNRAGRKGARSVQSTAGGTPAPPTPTKPTHMKSSNQPQNQHPHQQQQQAANAQNQAKGNEFVDFIYDYATKENGEGGESNGKNGEDSTNKKNKSFDAVVAGDLAGHREHVDKKQGRGERARAHTHGHAARKHKSPANKPNTKSTLVVDYIDASQNPQSYSSSNLTVPDMNAGNDSGHQFGEFTRPKAATESKPHRERARAQSHGHRKKGSGDAKSQNKQKGTSSSSDTSDREHVVNLLAVPPKPAKPSENGHRSKLSSSTNELDDTSRDDNRSHENLSDVSVHDSSMSEKPYEAMPSDKNKRDTPPSSTGENFENGTSSSDLAKLKHENAKLRKELADSRKSSDKDSKKIENMEAEIKKLKLREAEDAKTLETMVQHVEANLKRTTERAVTAENTITKLKAEIKQLKSELGGGSSGKQKTEENKELKDIREKANAASLKLATAAKEAETNIKQLMSGVDVLKVLAETLACIDRISEDKSDKPKSFGTAL